MKNNRKSKRWDYSTITPLENITEHIFYMVIIFASYWRFCFIVLNEFSTKKSLLIAVICMLVSSVIGSAIRWRKFLTTRAVFSDIMIGLGCYTILAYKDYYAKWINSLLILFLSVIIFYAISLLYCMNRGQYLSRIKDPYKKRLVIRKNICRTIYRSGLLLGLFMTVLMLPMVYNRLFHGGVLIADTKISALENFDFDYCDNEFGLSQNIESISKIRTDETWKPLTTYEKLTVLQDICNCETRYFGLDFQTTISVDDLGGSTLAYYSDHYRSITIDRTHLENDNAEEVLNTVLHEMYHAYEYSLCRLYLNSSDSERRLLVFDHCAEYLAEMEDYQDGGNDHEEFLQYYCQNLEQDSRTYAKRSIAEYYYQIDMILYQES